jgi:membrane protease YdiL (CAAX protease family)
MQYTKQENQSWLKLLVVLSFISILGYVTIIGENNDLDMNLDSAKTILLLKVLQGVSSILIFVVPSFLFALFWTKPKISYLGITKLPSRLSLFIASTGMLLALPLINILAEINQRMQLPYALSSIERWMQESEAKAEVLTRAFTAGTTIDVLIVNIIIIALLAALSEEMFFRGVLQNVLFECFKNIHVAIWISALIFSAFHMQFYGFLPRMLMGAYLGYLFYWSGSLWVAIAAHFVNNGMAVFFIWLSNRGTISSNIENVGAESGEWIQVIISLTMVITSLILIYKREGKNVNS